MQKRDAVVAVAGNDNDIGPEIASTPKRSRVDDIVIDTRGNTEREGGTASKRSGLEWTRKRWPDRPDASFIKPRVIADGTSFTRIAARGPYVELRPLGKAW